jgi:hypothetical protein
MPGTTPTDTEEETNGIKDGLLSSVENPVPSHAVAALPTAAPVVAEATWRIARKVPWTQWFILPLLMHTLGGTDDAGATIDQPPSSTVPSPIVHTIPTLTLGSSPSEPTTRWSDRGPIPKSTYQKPKKKKKTSSHSPQWVRFIQIRRWGLRIKEDEGIDFQIVCPKADTWRFGVAESNHFKTEVLSSNSTCLFPYCTICAVSTSYNKSIPA